MPATTAAMSVSDEAIEVLQRTSDGDDLSPGDLSLLQAVVNSGGLDRFTDAAKVRWEEVVKSARDGSYVQPFLKGLEHLTKDHDGYVRWRGKVVEHYDFGADLAGEKAAAQYLARCCLRLEKDGIQPTSQNLFGLYAGMRRAAEMGGQVPRYAVVWNTLHPGRSLDLRVDVIAGATDEAIIQELAQMAMDLGVDTTGRKTQQILITKEDYQTVVEGLSRTVQWSRSMAWRSGELQPEHPLYDEPAHSLAVLARFVNKDRLIDQAQVEDTYLGPIPQERNQQAHVREAVQ